MKKLALSASMLGALALAACGGGDDGGIIVPDGGGGDGGNVGICNPQTQAGCETGEKCTAIFPPEGTMGPVVTGCVPDGTVAEGDACTIVDTGRGDGTRTDDCTGGLFCDNQGAGDVCTPLCAAGVKGSCSDGAAGARACVGISGIFDDLPMGSETGVCVPQCEPVMDATQGRTNNECPMAERNDGAGGTEMVQQGCYMLFTTQEFICLTPATENVDLPAFSPCEPTTMAGDCFINSAPQGASIWFSENTMAATLSSTSPWCKPVPTDVTRQGGAKGDTGVLSCSVENLTSGAAGECRFLDGWFFDPGLVPEHVGMCIPFQNEGWGGSAEDFDLEAWAAAEVSADTADDFDICLGCVTAAEVDAAIAAAGGGNVAPRLSTIREVSHLKARIRSLPDPKKQLRR